MVAPGRARRPGAGGRTVEPATPEELESCPFCEGREDRTPPETLALPPREPPDSPGWRARVVPNLYPAFARQEVVVHSPRHKRSFAELGDGEVALTAEAWQRRRAAEPDGYLHALVNEGRDAGASLAHSHSQLVWFDEVPPAVRGETGPPQDLDVVLERDGIVAGCPRASRVPYETAVVPDRAGDAFASDQLASALLVVRDVVRALDAIEGHAPFNAWLHATERWHIEIVPRLTVFAGIELGAGIFVNTLYPLEAAKRLRAAIRRRG